MNGQISGRMNAHTVRCRLKMVSILVYYIIIHDFYAIVFLRVVREWDLLSTDMLLMKNINRTDNFNHNVTRLFKFSHFLFIILCVAVPFYVAQFFPFDFDAQIIFFYTSNNHRLLFLPLFLSLRLRVLYQFFSPLTSPHPPNASITFWSLTRVL